MGAKKGLSMRRFKGADGERFSVLVDSEGMPLFYPTLFSTWIPRGSSLAANTIANALSALKALLAWEAQRGIDLESSFARGVLLDSNEIRDLCDFLERPIEREKPVRVAPIRRRREIVGASEHYFRVTTAAQYLEFLAHRVAPQVADSDVKNMGSKIRECLPHKGAGLTTDRIEAHLSEEVIETIEAALRPDSADNPASDRGVQLRNALMFSILKHTGIRRGELLNLRVGDFNFGDSTMAVLRRADSSLDTRRHQPTVKTLSRRVRLAPALTEKVHAYVMGARRAVPGAKRHDYLFVTHKSGPTQGAPLSIGAFNKWMGLISGVVEKSGFHAHALRHNWNYDFSRLADKKGMSAAEEEKTRSYWMGWSETSGTAALYNRRHTIEKANEASLELQDHYLKMGVEG